MFAHQKEKSIKFEYRHGIWTSDDNNNDKVWLALINEFICNHHLPLLYVNSNQIQLASEKNQFFKHFI